MNGRADARRFIAFRFSVIANNHLQSTLKHCIHQAKQGNPLSDAGFNTLALEIFAHQYECNIPYRNYCMALGSNPDLVTDWREIPALPTDAFKHESSPLVTFPFQAVQKTFLTSGTTTETKGMHHFASTEIYEHSIISAWHELNLPECHQAIFLTPHPRLAPHSSLSHMMGIIDAHFTDTSSWIACESGELDTEKLIKAAASGRPVALLGTAISFLHLFHSLEKPVHLPEGSWAMETGGYKGTRLQLSKNELYHLFGEHLSLQPESIINEYSMTELSSQFYSRGLNHPHQGPSWTRIRVIDPTTNTDAKPGEAGHLIIYDLANLESVMAVRTQDLALIDQTALDRGPVAFTLLGRDPSALPRGCSRSSDEFLSS
ncbi:MAG: long-chain fatty acid--CoA ligase [Akkermansiaceae bacterium]